MAKNSLYNQMNSQQNNMNFFQALQELKSKGGDPNLMIQQLLDSGQVSQEQYNSAVQKAQQIQNMLRV